MIDDDYADRQDDIEEPSIISRIAAIAIGGLMVVWVSWGSSLATETHFAICLAIVSLGAAAIMVVLTVFGVKAFEGKESLFRFNLSSLMLVSVPLGIYLAGIRVIVSKLPAEEIPLGMWIFLCFFAVLSMAVVTLVLTAMAEAILWAAKLPFGLRESTSRATPADDESESGTGE